MKVICGLALLLVTACAPVEHEHGDAGANALDVVEVADGKILVTGTGADQRQLLYRDGSGRFVEIPTFPARKQLDTSSWSFKDLKIRTECERIEDTIYWRITFKDGDETSTQKELDVTADTITHPSTSASDRNPLNDIEGEEGELIRLRAKITESFSKVWINSHLENGIGLGTAEVNTFRGGIRVGDAWRWEGSMQSPRAHYATGCNASVTD